MQRRRHQRIALGLIRVLVYATVLVLVLIGIAVATVETAWGKNQLRGLIVRQANQYLTATLDIGRLEGSLVRGITLGDVRLSRAGHTLVGIDDVSLSYSLRELFDEGTVIRQIRLVRPHIVAAKQPDGRWDLAALVRRDARDRERSGPNRPIHIQSIEVMEGTVELRDPLRVGAANVPTRYDALNLALSFDYEPVAWRLTFSSASWVGAAPDLTITNLTGAVSSGRAGLTFSDLNVRTARAAFVLTGRVARDVTPTTLDLRIKADRFTFQDWAGVVRALRDVSVDAAFDVGLKGPLAKLATDVNLQSNGGDVRGSLVLDTTTPGWRGAGSVDLTRLDVSRWFNWPDRPSDVTGRVDFDLTQFVPGFPRGSYSLDATHAAFRGWAADHLRARGTLTATDVRITDATGIAYGAKVSVSNGSIAIDRPYPFSFQGTAREVDLRQLPASFPVPHVESVLAFDYDVTGRFTEPFVAGRAFFEPSEFLGAAIGAGAVGSIDTSTSPLRYSGEGEISHINLNRFGVGLQVAWLQDPRYAGTVSGRFRVAGAGANPATMILDGGGRLTRAELFHGTLSDADVTVQIEAGSLDATYAGRFASVNPAVALGDPRFEASMGGTGRARITVRDLLVRSPVLADYDIQANLSLEASTVRGVQLDTAEVDALLADGTLTVASVRAVGPLLEAQGKGVVELDGQRSSQFDYEVMRASLALVREVVGREMSGQVVTKGRLTGPTGALRLEGDGTINRLEVAAVRALTATLTYDVTVPPGAPADTTVHVDGRASFIDLVGRQVQQAQGTVTYVNHRLDLDVKLLQRAGVEGVIVSSMVVHPDRRALDLASLTVVIQNSRWQLSSTMTPPTVVWDEGGIALTPLLFTDEATGGQRIALSGAWRQDGSGALRITATRVFLDTFAGLAERPARYGGVLDLDATLRGTSDRPLLTSQLTVTEGRIRRFSYEKLAGRVDLADGLLDVDVRLDQSPGVYLTAVGTVPLALADRELPEKPINVAIRSSSIGLGLVEGATDVIRDVSGEMLVDVIAVGTSRDPHVTGSVSLTNAAFRVTASGARYKNGLVSVRLAEDRIAVEAFHLEDNGGRPLDMKGSLGTHELKVGDLEIDAVARGFEVLRNQFGTIDVDARLSLRGQFESPRIEGEITVVSGELNVNEILDRTLFQPYSIDAARPAADFDDAVAALNPWERVGLGIELHVPNTLRLTGDDVQVAAGTPLGLGSFNLRVIGDLYLYKDPRQPLSVTGSFDSVTGTYVFQGRRFDIDPTSSINFRGDRTPEVFVTVKRVISGVETRVTTAGPLGAPELRLSSDPPLDPSDILSLIVFNTSTNQLSAEQQRDLAVRAGTLAAGFLVTPLVTALERSLGLDILQIEATGDPGTARVTIGDELAPGLVARFSRQFGRDEYDEATLEYALSRILRIRATFSDAGSLIARSPFRRVERAGIDLILFLSF